jgi:hypothetical protein
MQFPVAFRLTEVRGIAKSVAEWTWRYFSEERFSARQALRGARRAAQMWAGHVAAETTKPWEAEEVSRATWYRRRAEMRSRSEEHRPAMKTAIAPETLIERKRP